MIQLPLENRASEIIMQDNNSIILKNTSQENRENFFDLLHSFFHYSKKDIETNKDNLLKQNYLNNFPHDFEFLENEKDQNNLFFEKITLLELLKFLNTSNIHNSGKTFNFLNHNNKLAKTLSHEKSINELKSAKSIYELIKLSKKFDLGLEKLIITTKNMTEFESKFSSLANKNFFQSKLPILPSETLMNTKKSNSLFFKTTMQNVDIIKVNNNTKFIINKILKNEDKLGKTNKDIKQNNFKTVILDIDQKNKQENQILKPNLKSILKDINTQGSNKIKIININDKKDDIKFKNLDTILNKFDEKKNESFNNENSSNKESDLNENKQQSIIKDITKQTQKQTKLSIKQTITQFSQDLNDQIKNYKPPISRVQLALNPKELGEVEVLITSRGSNLQISFISNNQTMNLFLQNQAEFKNSLVNMGFTELEMSFSQQKQNKEEGKNFTYNGEENEDFIEELALEKNVLNLTIPKYI